MRQILISAFATAALAAAPALAKPDHPEHPAKPPHPAKCKINSVGYNAKGTLVSQTLTQTAGVETTTDTSDDRWSGDVTVDVKKANHKAPKGEQTLTLTNAKVSWYDAANDGTADVPAAGDTVRLHGKLTKYKKKCPGADVVITVKRISFQQAAPTV
jgi:hypothetical protein